PALERDPPRTLPEAYELCVGTRARRETLRPDMKRLEQVRLAGAVLPDDQDQTRLQREVESRVRADVPERDRTDDQRLPGQPDRHDQVRRVVLATLDHSRPQR